MILRRKSASWRGKGIRKEPVRDEGLVCHSSQPGTLSSLQFRTIKTVGYGAPSAGSLGGLGIRLVA